MEREVTLAEVLAARELRAARQQKLLASCGTPLISFSMNIAGPVKDSPLIRRAFHAGCTALDAALKHAVLPVLCRRIYRADTGCEGLLAVDADALALKRLCAAIEDGSGLGRLFDMDVLTAAGEKLDRSAVGRPERGCLVCGAPGRGCASRRLHTVPELRAATGRIMARHFAAADCAAVSALVTGALLDEVHTTPKPGLVDRANTGSHRDMDLSTFRASIRALESYWVRAVSIGQNTAASAPEETFHLLRIAGRDAEADMYAATGGVNTHKGAIFTLGALCGSIGRLWRPEAPCRDISRILDQCAALTADASKRDLASICTLPPEQLTAGQRLYLTCGLPGIRGEVAAGLPGVRDAALPAFEAALAAGCSRNDAGAVALLHLIARGTDTNMLSRGGAALAAEAAERARALLERSPLPDTAAIAALDTWFVARNLSPGGCADLLAATYFLHDWSHAPAEDETNA